MVQDMFKKLPLSILFHRPVRDNKTCCSCAFDMPHTYMATIIEIRGWFNIYCSVPEFEPRYMFPGDQRSQLLHLCSVI
jgi:hypothetical protein